MSEIINISQFINNLSLHDTPLVKLSANYERREIEVELARFNDELQTYIPLKLFFEDVSEFHLPSSNNLSEQEITNVEIENDGTNHRIMLEVLVGFSGPLYTIEICFSKLRVQ